MFDRNGVLLLIDIKLDRINDEEMKHVFQQVFGTKRHTAWAREVYYHNAKGCCYQYCHKDTIDCVYGYTSQIPVEKQYPNTVIIPLSSLISGGINIGVL